MADLRFGGRRVPLPASRAARIALGGALIVGGIAGFLPILGFWMLPLGLLVLSVDLAIVRRRRRQLAVWWARRRQAKAAPGAAGAAGGTPPSGSMSPEAAPSPGAEAVSGEPAEPSRPAPDRALTDASTLPPPPR